MCVVALTIVVHSSTRYYDYKIELHSARKTSVDKEALIGGYLSKVELRVIRYVQDSVLRGRDVQAGAARAWIDLGIMQLGYLGAARGRWITAGIQTSEPELISCRKDIIVLKMLIKIYQSFLS